MNDREIIASVRDMQGSDGKEGHWYILGEKQRAALTRLLDATDPQKAEGHAKVLLLESNWIDEQGRSSQVELKPAMVAGALALTEAEALKKQVAELEGYLAESRNTLVRLRERVEDSM